MNTKTILGVVVVAVVLAGGAYLYSQKSTDLPAAGPRTVEERETKGQITPVAGDLSQYTSSEWGLTFQYPSNWKVVELNYNKETTGEEGLAAVRVTGDGYSLDFSTIGKDYPGGVDTITREYTIAGQKVQALEDVLGSGFTQGMPTCNGIGLTVVSPVSSKQITDKVIASVKCTK